MFVEGASLGWAGANPSLGLQHRLVGPGQCRAAIGGRQRGVPDVELGKPELLDGGPGQRGPRRRRGREAGADPAAASELGEWEARGVWSVGGWENGVGWGEKGFGIDEKFHGVRVLVPWLLREREDTKVVRVKARKN